jgi:oligopeptide/dipeptide ABC transporter ATP-binding protein
MSSANLLEAHDLAVHYPVSGGLLRRRRWLRAVDGVSLSLAAGETLGVVGESGCGKSTLGRALLGLTPIHAGTVALQGVDLTALSRRQLRAHRRHAQMVFQDPLASLDPRMTVSQILAEPVRIHEPAMTRLAVRARALALLERVGLAPDAMDGYPHEFSGGQCQRIGIARALMLRPGLLVCDEPVSALDVSIQGQIVNLLQDLQAEQGLGLVFIAHDLAVVRHISHRIQVMYLGQTVEAGPADAVFQAPWHPYTRGLLDAIPEPQVSTRREPTVLGEMPSPLDPPSGCAFHPRCPRAQARCEGETPALRTLSPERAVRCHFPLDSSPTPPAD